MGDGNRNVIDLREASDFLNERYEGRARNVEELGGGDWSRAYSFGLDKRSLVVRFGPYREDFTADRKAMAFAGPDLPIPKVLEIGDAIRGAYAISERHFGVFLETVDEERFRHLLPAVMGALDALRMVPVPQTAPVEWISGGPRAPVGWRDWLVSSLEDRPGERVSGWRTRLAEWPELEELFRSGERAMRLLLDCCPEIRHVLHSDLLNRNVLVSESASRLEAVFDWGCSVHGDFLYEVAWFTFWTPWYPSLAALDFRAVVRAHYAALGLDVPFFDERIRCYELHIGLLHVAYATFTGRRADRLANAKRLHEILEPQ